MPTLNVRLDDWQKQQLAAEAHARGIKLSVLVRERLGGGTPDTEARLEDMERRIRALEQMAGMQ